MDFVNHTPFPALAFGGVDQLGQSFHVVVLRQTLTWDHTGQLRYTEEQAPLCDEDEFFDENLQGSVRQESDLCQYKPSCDVIVNGHAHAPLDRSGRPAARFDIRLLVKRPDRPAPLPPQPQGLNPWMSADPHAMAQWRKQVERAQRTLIPGERLIDKILRIHGERHFLKEGAIQRSMDSTVTLATLGLVRPSNWRLTEASPEAAVPLRLERAFGGQCRIEANTPAAEKVPAKHRLTAEQLAGHPDSEHPPVAHDAYLQNAIGCGFASDWYLSATGVDRIRAPQIESPSRPITLQDFQWARSGQLRQDDCLVAGLGVRPKAHPDRARLVGTIDHSFVESDAALPENFDFAVWNAAWPDQQTEFLQGDETIGMINLCPASTPGAWLDDRGNVLLRLKLPGDLAFVLARFESGAIGELPGRLDTLIVDTDVRQVSCIWRATVAMDPGIRVLELRLLDSSEANTLRDGQSAAEVEATNG